MRRTLIGLTVLFAVAYIPFVTAAVTMAQGNAYEAFLTNNRTGSTHGWRVKTWPTKQACEDALGNINDYLAGVAKEQSPAVEYNDKVDPTLGQSVDSAVIYILQNTGRLPDLSIGCRLVETPGRPA